MDNFKKARESIVAYQMTLGAFVFGGFITGAFVLVKFDLPVSGQVFVVVAIILVLGVLLHIIMLRWTGPKHPWDLWQVNADDSGDEISNNRGHKSLRDSFVAFVVTIVIWGFLAFGFYSMLKEPIKYLPGL